jgi:hypothetical protein
MHIKVAESFNLGVGDGVGGAIETAGIRDTIFLK